MEFKVNDFVIRKAEYVYGSWYDHFPKYDSKPLKIVARGTQGISILKSNGEVTTWDSERFTKYKKFSYLAERMKSV